MHTDPRGYWPSLLGGSYTLLTCLSASSVYHKTLSPASIRVKQVHFLNFVLDSFRLKSESNCDDIIWVREIMWWIIVDLFKDGTSDYWLMNGCGWPDIAAIGSPVQAKRRFQHIGKPFSSLQVNKRIAKECFVYYQNRKFGQFDGNGILKQSLRCSLPAEDWKWERSSVESLRRSWLHNFSLFAINAHHREFWNIFSFIFHLGNGLLFIRACVWR